MFDLKPENKLIPKSGRLLIAEPLLQEPHFSRSVILLCEHDHEGSLGFVLNKQADLILSDVVDIKNAEKFTIFVGGPVNTGSLFFIHKLGNLIRESTPITPDLSMGGDFEQIKFLISEGTISPEQIKFFAGYSGWSAGQLDGEMKSESWYVSELDNHEVFGDGEKLWQSVVESMGNKFRILLSFPENPELN
jgi:putative transcriptional regulator